jgi:hypothetical protein
LQTADPVRGIDKENIPEFIQMLSRLMNVFGRFPDLQSLADQTPLLGDATSFELPSPSWLFDYDTKIGTKTFAEIYEMFRRRFANSPDHLAAVDDSQRAMDEYVHKGGMLVLRMQVITAKRV